MLGLDVDYDYSPSAWKKVVYAGTQSVSFPQASQDLKQLAELAVASERVRRATERIGDERVAERDAHVAAFQEMRLPERRDVPGDEPTPEVVCVQMDGGRFQFFDRHAPARNLDDTYWREMKVGCLWTMVSEVSTEDPCPYLPESFVDPERIPQLVREIKGFSGPELVAEEFGKDADKPFSKGRQGHPQPIARSLVASRQGVEVFGPLLAAEAYHRRFHAAKRKAFVADGSEANWGVWRRHFSDYVPVTDFIHGLTYVYAAATTGRPSQDGWQSYREWAQWLWSGNVEQIIVALENRQAQIGQPAEDTPKTAPAAVVAETLGYLRNQKSRMKYAEYRKQGLPITSSYVESAVKQINRRIKGTEKFWSGGAEAMLTLVADHLSDTPTLTQFWKERPYRLKGTRVYHSTAV